MKQGWLIVNEYLDTEKFLEIRKLFLSGAEKKNVKLTVYTNADFAVDLSGAVVKSRAFDEGEPEFIIFYDKDIALASALEKMGYRLYNSADAIDVCDSKVKTAEKIAEYNLNCKDDEAKILMPKTYKVPFTYENIGIKHLISLWHKNFSLIIPAIPIVLRNPRSCLNFRIAHTDCIGTVIKSVPHFLKSSRKRNILIIENNKFRLDFIKRP